MTALHYIFLRFDKNISDSRQISLLILKNNADPNVIFFLF